DACYLDILQFHGDETAGYCGAFKDQYKVINEFRIKDKKSLKDINDYDVDFYMLDTYSNRSKGGTGKVFDWKLIENFEFLKPVILSGGLKPVNVAEAIRRFSPYGVDVSSGVERLPGKKDPDLMKKFVENVRKIQ
ncbi:MAG: phosphoribosylanthranilate isomerase, partial [Candidatus Omnitrophica bacterium]|nr:phosphoribosylanthranilate isomerase [Candidatus Omnitrophota bacterium]